MSVARCLGMDQMSMTTHFFYSTVYSACTVSRVSLHDNLCFANLLVQLGSKVLYAKGSSNGRCIVHYFNLVFPWFIFSLLGPW